MIDCTKSWTNPDSREAAMAAKWAAAAEKKVRLLREAMQAIERSCLLDPPHQLQWLHIAKTAISALESTK